VLKVPVLLYHDVDAVPRPGLERWTASPEEFRQHVVPELLGTCTADHQ
jgi:hypothetical protein